MLAFGLPKGALASLAAGLLISMPLVGNYLAFARLFAHTLAQMRDAELTAHLGYDRYAAAGCNAGTSRNGHRPRTLRTSARSRRERDLYTMIQSSRCPGLVGAPEGRA